MRVFLDANVLFAAAIGGGTAKLWLEPRIQLVTSSYAVNETWLRLKHGPQFPESRQRLSELLGPPLELLAFEFTAQSPVPEPWSLPDPQDIPILLGAITAKCEYLLTGDAQCFGAYFGKATNGLTVLRPGRFMVLLGL